VKVYKPNIKTFRSSHYVSQHKERLRTNSHLWIYLWVFKFALPKILQLIPQALESFIYCQPPYLYSD